MLKLLNNVDLGNGKTIDLVFDDTELRHWLDECARILNQTKNSNLKITDVFVLTDNIVVKVSFTTTDLAEVTHSEFFMYYHVFKDYILKSKDEEELRITGLNIRQKEEMLKYFMQRLWDCYKYGNLYRKKTI